MILELMMVGMLLDRGIEIPTEDNEVQWAVDGRDERSLEDQVRDVGDESEKFKR